MATLLLYSVLLRYAIALPTSPSPITDLSVDNSTSVSAATSDAPAFDTNYRSTVEIVLSCLSVIIASSWLCVHPNVTGINTTMWQRFRERLLLFAITIFAPEIMAVFAYYQWKGCRKLYKKFKRRAEILDIPLLESEDGHPSDSEDDLYKALTTRSLAPEELATSRRAVSEEPTSPNRSVLEEAITTKSSVLEETTIAGTDVLEEPPITRSSLSEGPTTTNTSIPKKPADALDPSVRVKAESGSSVERWWSPLKTLARAISSSGTHPKKARWSHTHAHFIQMGGIMFRNEKRKVGFKRPEEWKDSEFRAFLALNLTETAISDKSKAGALAKTLVVARVLWFLIQAIARKAQGLPIALLEVASLAFIAFNFAMYMFWWNKPLDVEFPLEIPGIPGRKDTVEKGLVLAVTAGMLLGLLENIPIGAWTYSPKRQRYPRLYSYGERSTYDGDDWIFRLTIAATSSAFGAFHTIGWYLPAPTHVERTLWRVACLVLTLYPLLLIPMLILSGKSGDFIDSHLKYHLYRIALSLFIIIGFACGIAYIGARLTVLFLPFFELRNLPPLIHRTVSWTRFLSPI